MSLLEQLKNRDEKPTVCLIHKSEKTNYIAIRLKEGQILKKHKTPIRTTLMVVKGLLIFQINDDIILLKELDTYEIPIDIEHEVIGLGIENVFTLIQEKQ